MIGRRLAQILIADGWRVIGTTRSRENACALRAIGVEPAVLNVFNAREVNSEIAAKARPDVVIHELSDLPDGRDPSRCVMQ